MRPADEPQNPALPPRQIHLTTVIVVLTIAAVVFSAWRQLPPGVRENFNPLSVPSVLLTAAAVLYELRRYAIRYREQSLLLIGWFGAVAGGALVALFFGGVWIGEDVDVFATLFMTAVLCPLIAIAGLMLTAAASFPALLCGVLVRPLCGKRSVVPSAVCGAASGASVVGCLMFFNLPVSLVPVALAAAVIHGVVAVYAVKTALTDLEQRPPEPKKPLPDWPPLLAELDPPPESPN